MAHSDWSDIPPRLARLATLPDAAGVFGARWHGWRLDPPLTVDEVAELEEQTRVELPTGYRSFLLEVGSGGAGPACGLFPARRVDGRWRWEWSGDGGPGDTFSPTDDAELGRPFAHAEAFNPADGFPDRPERDDYDSSEAFTEAEDAYQEEYDEVVLAPEHFHGLLYLCHVGCANYEVLVVSGPARGQVWEDRTADDGGLLPIRDETTPVGFTEWYRRWLDDAEERAGVRR